MKTTSHYSPTSIHGFTLIEIAVVLVIFGLLIGGLLMPLSAQMDQRNLVATRTTLENVKEALIGFAMTNGRLPCPATAASNGIENPVGGGACTNNYDGFLPAVTLGISGVDGNGYLVDSWGGNSRNRIRYAVSNANGNAFTTTSGMRNTTMATLAPNLFVCASATNINAVNCNTAIYLAGSAALGGVPVVVYSVGKNGATGGAGTDEVANPNPNSANNDPVFVSHEPTPTGFANGQFDDIVTWISSSTLYSRMVQAGQLP
ncbi:MAG: type II secretion system protein [Methylophilaceae bacterium]